MPSLVVVAGDPSGDAHAARLITALRARLPGVQVSGFGGPALRQAGVEVLEDLTAAAAIGPFDAARHLGRLLRVKRLFDAHLAARRPDLVLLVDFGDFNLPVLAPIAKRHGVRVAYYISPQLWAWGRFRLRYVRRCVDRMLVLFPFEETFYREAGVPVTWVGHPLLDASAPPPTREAVLARLGLNPWRVTVGLLPGSRPAEVARHLPLMLRAARRVSWRMPGVQWLVPRAPSVPLEQVRRCLAAAQDATVTLAEGPLADALPAMEAAVVVSGTATLEAALGGVPMVVLYRTSWPTYLAARSVVRVPHIAMVNIVAGRAVVPELLQSQASPSRLAEAMVALLRDDERRAGMRAALREVRERLGPPGAVERAAGEVAKLLD
jgi:lipid-A-disaccharide synthase